MQAEQGQAAGPEALRLHADAVPDVAQHAAGDVAVQRLAQPGRRGILMQANLSKKPQTLAPKPSRLTGSKHSASHRQASIL